MINDLITDLRDCTHLVWSERAATSGTGGTFLKAREGLSRERRYYKLSCYDSYRGVYGHECVNELIASRLAGLLGIAHVPYKLIHARVRVNDVEFATWLSESPEFKSDGEKKIAFDLFYDLHRFKGESPYELCVRFGWQTEIERMIAFDYLIANRDRHGANIEVLRSEDGSVRLAPIFDNGLSLIFSCYGDERRAAENDPMRDVNSNNYIGTRSLEENLSFIKGPLGFHSITQQDVALLLDGLESVLPPEHKRAIREMIWLRWCRLVDLGLAPGSADGIKQGGAL